MAADSPSAKAWRRWFERLGTVASVDVVNATAELVIAEREIAASRYPETSAPIGLTDDDVREILRNYRPTVKQ